MNTIARLFALPLLLALTAGAVNAGTWEITPGGLGESPTIMAAVDTAAPGDTILLAPGVYTGPENREISFGGKDIVLTSTGGPVTTIIDCEGLGRAFSFTQGETNATIITGITVMNADWGSGGAIYMDFSSPTITGNVFVNNNGLRGGAIYVKDSSPVITSNRFDNNTAGQYGGALYLDKSGASVIHDNVITNNYAYFGGGGIYSSLHTPSIVNNIVAANSSLSGGGMYFVVSEPVIEGNTIVENTASTGSGILFSASSPTVRHTIIALNLNGAGVACSSSGAPTFDCSLVFANQGGDGLCGIDAGNNVFSHPLFCDAVGTGIYTLAANSPCAAGNTPCGQQIGAKGVDCAVIAVEQKSWGQIKQLFSN